MQTILSKIKSELMSHAIDDTVVWCVQLQSSKISFGTPLKTILRALQSENVIHPQLSFETRGNPGVLRMHGHYSYTIRLVKSNKEYLEALCVPLCFYCEQIVGDMSVFEHIRYLATCENLSMNWLIIIEYHY